MDVRRQLTLAEVNGLAGSTASAAGYITLSEQGVAQHLATIPADSPGRTVGP